MTGNGQHHANVQVLTAEVRTLVVRSRQVTLSVFNQLDEVDPEEVEPFGRVCPKSAQPAFVHVVGRGLGGELVRSKLPRWPCDMDARGYVPVDPGGADQRWFPSGYSNLTDRERGLLFDRVRQWESLPLIVLAGLR